MSNCTMGTELLSNIEERSSDGEYFRGNEEDALLVEHTAEARLLGNIRREGLRRTGSIILPLTDTWPLQGKKLCEIGQLPREESDSCNGHGAATTELKEDQPEKKVNSVANYYQGNPSDWKLNKTTHYRISTNVLSFWVLTIKPLKGQTMVREE